MAFELVGRSQAACIHRIALHPTPIEEGSGARRFPAARSRTSALSVVKGRVATPGEFDIGEAGHHVQTLGLDGLIERGLGQADIQTRLGCLQGDRLAPLAVYGSSGNRSGSLSVCVLRLISAPAVAPVLPGWP